jgi:hypothetical protein
MKPYALLANKVARTIVASITATMIGVLSTNTSAYAQTLNEGRMQHDLALLVIFLCFLLVYSIPIIIAFYRKHPNRWPIFAITVLFGATGLGWLGAMLWALSAVHKSPTGNHGGESGLNLFVNDNQQVEQKLETDNSGAELDTITQLQKLKSLLDDDAITVEEYAQMKAKLLG